ncbi:MAG: hypothetical protein WC976_06045 [Caldisericia bacterium]
MKKWTVRIDNVKFHVGCINFSADTIATVSADPNFNADADGNRGTSS